MQLGEFIGLVAAMRSAQRRYFETRSRSVLAESKRLEREVDDVLCRIALDEIVGEIAERATERQGGLFDGS